MRAQECNIGVIGLGYLGLPFAMTFAHDELTPMEKLARAVAVVFAVAHREYVDAGSALMTWLLKDGKGTMMDVKSRLDRAVKPEGIDPWRL